MDGDANGNLMGTTSAMISPRNNNDEDSTSEYTDPENSAPTELLAEFLTSIMRKDYVNALKYCKMSNLYDNYCVGHRKLIFAH